MFNKEIEETRRHKELTKRLNGILQSMFLFVPGEHECIIALRDTRTMETMDYIVGGTKGCDKERADQLIDGLKKINNIPLGIDTKGFHEGDFSLPPT